MHEIICILCIIVVVLTTIETIACVRSGDRFLRRLVYYWVGVEIVAGVAGVIWLVVI